MTKRVSNTWKQELKKHAAAQTARNSAAMAARNEALKKALAKLAAKQL